MATSRIPEAALLGLALLGTGCSTAPADEPEEEPPGALPSALISSNRLSMNSLSTAGLDLQLLTTDRLSADGVNLAPTDLLYSKEGRSVLSYSIRCALPEGQSLKAKKGNKTYTWSGSVGIAPEWLSGSLSASGQRWMTACLLAHLNAYDVEVPISLRGASPALATTPDELATFTVEEMAFYGNIFDDDAWEEFYACAGKTLQAACAEDDGYSPRRACDPDEPCPINMAGACYDMTPTAKDSCGQMAPSYYNHCHEHARPRPATWPAYDFDYSEVITVYLKPKDFAKFYKDGCIDM